MLPMLRFALVVAVLFASGCSSCRREGDACSGTERCADGLACIFDRCGKCETSDSCRQIGKCALADGRCAVKAEGDASCAEKQGTEGYLPCEQDGLCHAVAGVCAATTAEDCKASRACKTSGACSVKNGACAAATGEDCVSSVACLELGSCSPRDGACVIAGDEDCERSKACLGMGRCSAEDGSCVVTKDADCKKSALCTAHGQCTARGTTCVAAAGSQRPHGPAPR
jgi:hypothetical protein